MGGRERRTHPRLKKEAPLILIHKGAGDAREGAVIHDVSLGGLCFETSYCMDPGDSFDFAIFIPSRGWVDGTGRISWTQHQGKSWLCGATMAIKQWDQKKLMRKWLTPSARGLLRFFFPEKGTPPPPESD